MKYFAFFIIIILLQPITNICFAGDDSLYVEIKSDTLLIHNVNVWEHCAFLLDYTIDIIDTIITITQVDTADDVTTCSEYHNFVFPIVGLDEGDYRVDIYRDCLYQDIRYINSLNFTLVYSSIPNNDPHYLPNNYILLSAYPNPFNPSTTIEYFINYKSRVRVNIHNILGEHIMTLKDHNDVPGLYRVKFNATNFPSGMYFCTIETNKLEVSTKIILMK